MCHTKCIVSGHNLAITFALAFICSNSNSFSRLISVKRFKMRKDWDGECNCQCQLSNTASNQSILKQNKVKFTYVNYYIGNRTTHMVWHMFYSILLGLSNILMNDSVYFIKTLRLKIEYALKIDTKNENVSTKIKQRLRIFLISRKIKL